MIFRISYACALLVLLIGNSYAEEAPVTKTEKPVSPIVISKPHEATKPILGSVTSVTHTAPVQTVVATTPAKETHAPIVVASASKPVDTTPKAATESTKTVSSTPAGSQTTATSNTSATQTPSGVSQPTGSAATLVMPPPGMTAQQQKQVEDIIHYYLVKNPEVIIEAIQALQQKQVDEAHKAVQKTQENAPKFADAIFHQANDPFIGNSAGKVTVVDFFDYQCPHCTKMTPILETLTKSNPQLRVIFKEFPIRGPLSEYASKVVLAAKNQGKYFEIHKALMVLSDQQKLTEESIINAAKSLGLNIDKLKTEMKSDAINQEIKNNVKLGQDLQLLGTPAFFIAKTAITKESKAADIVFIPGQVDQAQLQELIVKVGK